MTHQHQKLECRSKQAKQASKAKLSASCWRRTWEGVHLSLANREVVSVTQHLLYWSYWGELGTVSMQWMGKPGIGQVRKCPCIPDWTPLVTSPITLGMRQNSDHVPLLEPAAASASAAARAAASAAVLGGGGGGEGEALGVVQGWCSSRLGGSSCIYNTHTHSLTSPGIIKACGIGRSASSTGGGRSGSRYYLWRLSHQDAVLPLRHTCMPVHQQCWSESR